MSPENYHFKLPRNWRPKLNSLNQRIGYDMLKVFSFSLLLLFVSCGLFEICDYEYKPCPSGAMYNDFYDHQVPESLHFLGTDGTEIVLDLWDSNFYEGGTISWCPEEECGGEPDCPKRFSFTYRGNVNGGNFRFILGGNNDSNDVVTLIFYGHNTYPMGNLHLQFNPLDLEVDTIDYTTSEIAQIELNDIQYQNVFYFQYQNDNEINDIYLSSEAGLIQFTLTFDNTSVVFHKIE